MTSPTYTLQPPAFDRGRYRHDVSRLADLVLERGRDHLLHLVRDYGDFVEEIGAEPRRGDDEYLLEALTLGLLWRARGDQATALAPGLSALARRLAAGRRSGGARRRDGSNALLLSIDLPHLPGAPDPSLEDVDALLDWLLATGEYDDEVRRLEGWRAWLAADPLSAPVALEELVAFAAAFQRWAEDRLGRYTAGVARFLRDDLPRRRWREDTVQCARRPEEYQLSMVGAELLNRAWREAFLARRRHVVVLPGCMRSRPDELCRAERREHDLRCAQCTAGCPLAGAVRAAGKAGAEAVAVIHGSDFGAFLRSTALAGDDVGIVGVACAPGLLGAGWRAREAGLPAQCVLLDASGCGHWLDRPAPTRIDLAELGRILAGEVLPAGAARVA